MKNIIIAKAVLAFLSFLVYLNLIDQPVSFLNMVAITMTVCVMVYCCIYVTIYLNDYLKYSENVKLMISLLIIFFPLCCLFYQPIKIIRERWDSGWILAGQLYGFVLELNLFVLAILTSRYNISRKLEKEKNENQGNQ